MNHAIKWELRDILLTHLRSNFLHELRVGTEVLRDWYQIQRTFAHMTNMLRITLWNDKFDHQPCANGTLFLSTYGNYWNLFDHQPCATSIDLHKHGPCHKSDDLDTSKHIRIPIHMSVYDTREFWEHICAWLVVKCVLVPNTWYNSSNIQ